jgi:hypothetical protein
MNKAKSILLVGILTWLIAIIFFCPGGLLHAQQATAPLFYQTDAYATALNKAREDCKALWSDHSFDRLRDIVPLGEEKPSFSMLTNKEKLHSKDKPLADLAIKTLEKCRRAYEPVYALLPPNIHDMIRGVEREQDALIADLFNRKITFGDYNVGMNQLTGKLSEALYGILTAPASTSKSPSTILDSTSHSAQQFDAVKYQVANTKATKYCVTLWSDHAFDPLRDKIPLLGDPPTPSMFTSTQRMRPEDKPLADLHLKAYDKCKAVMRAVWAMLPPAVNAKVLAVAGQFDALNAELYTGKITFGGYNVKRAQILKQMALAFTGMDELPKPSAPTEKLAQPAALDPDATQSPPASPNAAPKLPTPHEVRIALVIGESRYSNLPRLLNPERDARSIADTLQKMGYETQLLLDASDDGIRKAIRKFANESGRANVAVVFYAGHGAQLNGSNYLLPIDIDIPHTEADIQLAGLKVDDLVNSITSNTKIVFLDACRDNPALFKNLVNGRGSSPAGLAPATASNFNPAKLGGGIFIAYATDAGAVADDGHGQHSPFTQALLRNMQKPISIDDMFSLVTKEVRLVTKNAQRPFKYASLENIICLTPDCVGTPGAVAGNIVQQATQSEDEELQIALQTKNIDALETYLQKYPETKKRSELQTEIATLKRLQLTEWTLYEVGNQHIPNYIQLSSLQMFEGRAAVMTKTVLDSSQPKVFYGKDLPDAAYAEELAVYDCAKPAMAVAETTIFDKSANPLYHYKWADPQYLNLSIGPTLRPGSIGLTARNIVCHKELGVPLVSRRQLEEMKFTSLASMPSGDGEIFFGAPRTTVDGVQDQKEVILVLRTNVDKNVNQFLPQGVSLPNPPNFRFEVDHVLLNCKEDKFLIDKTEFWSATKELVRVQALDKSLPYGFSKVEPLSVHALMQEVVCGKTYAGVGIRVKVDSGAIKVAEVFSGSPAEKAGVKVDDVITDINSESINGRTLEEVVDKLRGPATSNVTLTILPLGLNKAVEVTVDREIIQRPPMPEGSSK